MRQALSGNRHGEAGGLAASRQGLQGYLPSFAAALAAAAAACVPTPGGRGRGEPGKCAPASPESISSRPKKTNWFISGCGCGAYSKQRLGELPPASCLAPPGSFFKLRPGSGYRMGWLAFWSLSYLAGGGVRLSLPVPVGYPALPAAPATPPGP